MERVIKLPDIGEGIAETARWFRTREHPLKGLNEHE